MIFRFRLPLFSGAGLRLERVDAFRPCFDSVPHDAVLFHTAFHPLSNHHIWVQGKNVSNVFPPVSDYASCSFPLFFFPIRSSLFKKSKNPLFGIIRCAQTGERFIHMCELLLIFHILGCIKSAFGNLHGYGALLRQFFRVATSFGLQFVLWEPFCLSVLK